MMGVPGGLRSLLRFEIHFLKHTLSHSNFTFQQFWRGISSPWERALFTRGARQAALGWAGLGVLDREPGVSGSLSKECVNPAPFSMA